VHDWITVYLRGELNKISLQIKQIFKFYYYFDFFEIADAYHLIVQTVAAGHVRELILDCSKENMNFNDDHWHYIDIHLSTPQQIVRLDFVENKCETRVSDDFATVFLLPRLSDRWMIGVLHFEIFINKINSELFILNPNQVRRPTHQLDTSAPCAKCV
jgi:hypothetical protein